MIVEKSYNITLEKLYEQNKLLTSAIFEIHGDNVKSASLFCIDYDISLRDRDKIILLLNKFSDSHNVKEILFWKKTLCSEIPFLATLDDEKFFEMINMFWEEYVSY
ncbi:hypothetical protein [Streptococcus suis]|uniref:hypothetical protein n=1 Tax=Streptococcus suis TaxID=1307 RepID=UPI0004629515|nr:hypothetical protein [Streptococcus suis]HEM3180790.1 hypothetical protein [Streptococcus suis 92-4172]